MYERDRYRPNIRRRVRRVIAPIALAVIGTGVAAGIAGGYFFPRGQRVEVPVVATPTPRAAAGTPRPSEANGDSPVLVPTDQIGERMFAENEWLQNRINPRGEIPESGTELQITLQSGEIGAVTGGPMKIPDSDLKLDGEVETGSVVVFVNDSNNQKEVELEGLITGNNWATIYDPPEGVDLKEAGVLVLEDRINAMHEAPNCTHRNGCNHVQGRVIDASDNNILHTKTSSR